MNCPFPGGKGQPVSLPVSVQIPPAEYYAWTLQCRVLDNKKQWYILRFANRSSRGGSANMETPRPTESYRPGEQIPSPLRSFFSDAARYWEPRRLVYNFALAAVCVAWLVLTWPHFRPALSWSFLLLFVVLGLIANACYCAAYLVDIPLQQSSLGTVWRRRRWVLWLMGTLLAIVLANYWIGDEIYPFVR
jgi:hypothetical protein